MTSIRRLVAVSLLLALAPGPARAAEHRAISEFAFGLAAVGVNFLYGPAKVLYAFGGSIVAPLAYLSAGQDRSVFRKVLQPAVRGDYALTAANLRGERPWHFFGRDPERGPYPY